MQKQVKILDKAEVNIRGKTIAVKGPIGELSRSFDDPRFEDIKMQVSGDEFTVSCQSEARKMNAMVGTIAAHVRNMVSGATSGYTYELKIVFKHFPLNVSQKGSIIEIKNFLGEKSVRTAKIVGKCDVKIDKDTIIVKGASKEDVGQTAANIELACKLTGRDRRIFQDGIFIVSKAR